MYPVVSKANSICFSFQFFVYSVKGSTEWIELKTVLNPLMDILMKLGTNPYISTLKTDKSLQLLLKLLQTCPVKCSSPQVG